jgi:hypothetical protein
MAADAPIRFTLLLTNRLDVRRTVVLEPWTGEYHLDAGTQLQIVVEGTPKTPLEVELIEDRIVVYAFDTTKAMLTAHRDGRALTSEHNPPAA